MSLTSQHFRDILDEIGICHKINKENGLIEFIMSQTEPFEADFKFIFNISEENNLLFAYGLLGNFDLEDSFDFYTVYKFCNEWNASMWIPKVSVTEQTKLLTCEWMWDTDYEISDEMLKGLILANFIKYSMQCINKAVDKGLYPELKDVQQ